MRALLFLAGVQLSTVCILTGAVLLYNDRWPGWVLLAMAVGFLPAVKLK